MSGLEEEATARVEIFGSLFCPYCSQAKRFMVEKGIAFRYREVPMLLGWKLPLPVYREMRERSGGQRTVPQIFVDGAYYGDEERLFADDREGLLERFLNKPAAEADATPESGAPTSPAV